MRRMIITNLRMPENMWLQVKSTAAELGISVNEYLNNLIWEVSGRKQLGIKSKKKRVNEKKFWEIYKLMDKIEYKPMGLSKEDEIIYGI